MDVFSSNNNELLQKKRNDYIEQRKDEFQLKEDYFSQYNKLDQDFAKEANEKITEQNLNDYILAEKEAGLEQKKIPQIEIPQKTMEEIEVDREIIHKEQKMSDKERKNAKKMYNKKIKRTRKAEKIKDNFSKYWTAMDNKVLSESHKRMGISGNGALSDNERKNLGASIWMNTFTGGSQEDMVKTLLNLSVSAENADEQQAEKKAHEIEKMFKVILNFDLKKLKYNNSDEFLKNATERKMIGQFAAEMDHQIDSYRRLVERGILEKPLDQEILNEIEARNDLIMHTSTRTNMKLDIIASEQYTIRDKEVAERFTDLQIGNRGQGFRDIVNDKNQPEEVRKKALNDTNYFGAVNVVKNMELNKKKTDCFRRGDDPETILKLFRQQVNEKHKISGNAKKKKDVNVKQFRATLNQKLAEKDKQ